MRVLRDEHLPVDLALELAGHDVVTVVGRDWAGSKNGDRLRRMRGDSDVLLTRDRGIEFHAASGQSDQVLALAQTAPELAPDDPQVSNTLGSICYRRGVRGCPSGSSA